MFVQKKLFQTTASKLRDRENDRANKDFSSTSCMNDFFTLLYFAKYFL
jgi:hypothetical protein